MPFTSLRLPRPLLVSFSGVDGAGKSTQIANLRSLAEYMGLRVCVRAFWDDVVVLKRHREGFVRKVFKSEAGVGEPGRAVARRDKNVRGWHMDLVRHALYAMDAIHLPFVVERAQSADVDVVIMDRYIYDELANLALENRLTLAYLRALLAIVPVPDLAIFLDADPVAARERKPEYPVEFLQSCRAAYLHLAQILDHVTVIPPLQLAAAKNAVEQAFMQVIGRVRAEARPSLDKARAA